MLLWSESLHGNVSWLVLNRVHADRNGICIGRARKWKISTHSSRIILFSKLIIVFSLNYDRERRKRSKEAKGKSSEVSIMFDSLANCVYLCCVGRRDRGGSACQTISTNDWLLITHRFTIPNLCMFIPCQPKKKTRAISPWPGDSEFRILSLLRPNKNIISPIWLMISFIHANN